MKALIALILLMAAFWVGKRLFLTYQSVEKNSSRTVQSGAEPDTPQRSSTLSGLPPALEASLAEAQRQGAAGLRQWLRNYRSQVRDPRLAAIELDYVVLIGLQDPVEARRIFQSVKARTPTFSPVYARVKRLESTFQ